MIPGPGPLHDEDLAVMGTQLIAHYGEVWVEIHTHILESLKTLLNCSELPYVMPGSGTTGLDAVVMNMFEPGQKVVVANTGFFGMRLMEIARASRLKVIEVPVEIGKPVDPDAIRVAAEGADGVLTTHVDTSTGVRHPIKEIAAAVKEAGAIYVVDGIASVAGELVDVEGWGIDAIIAGTQKGLEAPPGLVVIGLGSGGRERLDSRKEGPPSWFMSFKTWDRYRNEWGGWHPHPVTVSTSLFLALASSLDRILVTGLDKVVEQRAELAAYLRQGLRDLGLRIVPEEGYEANLVVAAYAEDSTSIVKHLLGQGIMISGGLAPLQGKTIRVGLMGKTATREMADRVLKGIGEAV